MKRYREVIDKYNKIYNEVITKNRQLLIEAYVQYYGENARDRITSVIDDIFITWNISPIIGQVYDELVTFQIINNRLNYTVDILKLLGINIEKFCCEVGLGKLYYRAGKLCIDPGFICGAKEEKTGESYDELLEKLFGKRKIFNFDYENDVIYNFYKLSSNEQRIVVKSIFNGDEISPEILGKIDSVIEYLDSIKDKKDYEANYEDIFIVRNHMGNFRLDKRIIKKILSIPSLKIVGSLDGRYDSRRFGKLLEGDIVSESFTLHVTNYDEQECYKFITFPIICADDITFIHELNHAITSDVYGVIDNKVLSRYGISVNDDYFTDNYKTRVNLEEYINQASSLEITDIFHNLGGNLFPDGEFLKSPIYNGFLPLISSFYETYKEQLKRVRIDGNVEYLFKFIDKEMFIEYLKYINLVTDEARKRVTSLYVEDGESLASEGQIRVANEFVRRMDKNNGEKQLVLR